MLNSFLFLNTKNAENVFGKGCDFCHLCYGVLERPLFREKKTKEADLLVFFTVQGRAVLSPTLQSYYDSGNPFSSTSMHSCNLSRLFHA